MKAENISSVLIKSDLKDKIKESIQFENTDLADFIRENKPTSQMNKDQQNTLKSQPGRNDAENVFKPRKKTVKNIWLQQRPAYSPRDIALDLINIEISQKKLQTSDEVLTVYLKKTLLWCSSISIFAGILLGANFATSLFFDNSLSEYLIIAMSTALSAGLFLSLSTIKHKQEQKQKKLNILLKNSDSHLIQAFVNELSSKFKIENPDVIFSLKPEIYIKKLKNKSHLILGLPILHAFSNRELCAVLSYHMEYFRICQQHHLLKFFKNKTQAPFSFRKNQSNGIAESFFRYPVQSLNKAIQRESILASIQASDFDTLIASIEKTEKLLLGYMQSICATQKSEMIPINAITQVICTSESKDIKYQVECQHFKDNLKAILSNHADSLELQHKKNLMALDYSCSWLLTEPNKIANTISLSILGKLGFTENQLQKTHDVHKPFQELNEQDLIQKYYASFYRVNRGITPDLSDSDAGSLLSLKTELQALNHQIIEHKPDFDKLIYEWDKHKAPHHNRQNGLPSLQHTLERAHLELLEIERLLGKKSGLCLSITLSFGTPLEQKNLYLLLDAHRKSISLNRTIDNLYNSILVVQTQSSTENFFNLRQDFKTLLGLCVSLPDIQENPQFSPHMKAQIFIKNMGMEQNKGILLADAIELINQLDDYRWAVEKQLVSVCQKVEERLNISPVFANVQ